MCLSVQHKRLVRVLQVSNKTNISKQKQAGEGKGLSI